MKINAVLKDESLWLTQLAMTQLFEVDKSSISRHLRNIFAEGELDERVVVAKFATTTPHGAIAGKTQEHVVNFYNLDAIIAVGYRVNSRRATQFRIWAIGFCGRTLQRRGALRPLRFARALDCFAICATTL